VHFDGLPYRTRPSPPVDLERVMALDARDGLTSGCNSTEGETPTMRLTSIAHHLMPFAALAGGILVLLMPRLLNYVVAIYLILVGFIGLNGLYHFVR
jgi:Protein of unknown function (DUF3096)